MTKKDFSTLVYKADVLDQLNQNTINKMVTVLEASFSAIATADPELALSIIEQLNEQKSEILSVFEDRKLEEEAFVKKTTKNLAESIDFDEDFDPSEMN